MQVIRNEGTHPNRLCAALVYDGLCTFEFGIVADVLGYDRPEMGHDWYKLVSCGVEPGPARAVGGLLVTAQAGLEVLEKAGTIIIPGWPRTRQPPAELASALRSAADRGARLVSICSGAFLLAWTGLLKGKRVTTHWKYVDDFRRLFPDIEVLPDVLYVDEGSILSSAGSAAGMDLLLHMVRKDFGPDAANRIARGLVIPAHREGGQAQFIERPVPANPNGRLAPLFDYMRKHIAENMTVAKLARQAAMSERTFLRRFKEMTGVTPAAWLMEERLRTARQMLEEEPASIETIAFSIGFGTAATMRLHFRNRLGISPSEYRNRFTKRQDNIVPMPGRGMIMTEEVRHTARVAAAEQETRYTPPVAHGTSA